MTADLDDVFEELRRDYLAEAPARLMELRKDLSAFTAGEPDADRSLRARFHRLAGSGGSYGFPTISSTSREIERALADGGTSATDLVPRVERAITALAAAFDAAARQLGISVGPARKIGFSRRAVVIGADGLRVDRIAATLREAQFEVSRVPAEFTPEAVPISERYDLAIVATAPDHPAVNRWARQSPDRPNLVVLVTDTELDPLSGPGVDLDATVPDADLEVDLGSFARHLTTAATAPPLALLIEPDPDTRTTETGWLEGVGIRVIAIDGAAGAVGLLERERPDLVVLNWHLPDRHAEAVLRLIRRQPMLCLTPVVTVMDGATDADRGQAIRAGVDQIIERPLSQRLFSDTVLARSGRGRTVRGMVHRDDWSGLLNQAALLAELERAIAYGQRTGEEFAFVIFDVDHIKRINELHGYPVGDQVIAHIGQTLLKTLRSSDVVARVGGEEFGVILRACPASHAGTLADKLRRAVADDPTTAGTATVVAKVSAGIACYPIHGRSATELRAAADRALGIAKQTGRDRAMMSEGRR